MTNRGVGCSEWWTPERRKAQSERIRNNKKMQAYRRSEKFLEHNRRIAHIMSDEKRKAAAKNMREKVQPLCLTPEALEKRWKNEEKWFKSKECREHLRSIIDREAISKAMKKKWAEEGIVGAPFIPGMLPKGHLKGTKKAVESRKELKKTMARAKDLGLKIPNATKLKMADMERLNGYMDNIEKHLNKKSPS